MKTLILILLVFNSIHLIAQEAWTLTISSPRIERIFDIRETAEGNYIAVGRRESAADNMMYGFLAKISADGQLLNEQELIFENSFSSFHHIMDITDTSFVVIGAVGPVDTFLNELWVLHLNYDLEITKQILLFSLPNLSFYEFHPKYISNGNILIHGFVADSNFSSQDLFFFETNLNGDSITSALIEIEGSQFSNDFIERKNGEGYYAYVMGYFPVNPPGVDNLVKFDTNFNYISVDSVPGNLYNQINAKWMSDYSYLITGKYRANGMSYCNMGILKLDNQDNILNGNFLGMMSDTNTYPGSNDNLDFRNPDTIFYSGTGNFVSYPWQNQPSWIIVNCLDSNLDLHWQSIYGGDAFYHSWEVYATSDGGCLVSAHKFDFNTGIFDYDVVLLKYDANGLITHIEESETSPQSMLIYPNPGKDQIIVDNNFDDGLFRLFDQSGRCVLEFTLTHGSNRINVSGIQVGIYIYMISADQNQVSAGKWIKR
jgi:hypothetical protein